jgi:hypothetical protein
MADQHFAEAAPLKIVSVAFGSLITQMSHTWLYVVDDAGRLWVSVDAKDWMRVPVPTTRYLTEKDR